MWLCLVDKFLFIVTVSRPSVPVTWSGIHVWKRDCQMWIYRKLQFGNTPLCQVHSSLCLFVLHWLYFNFLPVFMPCGRTQSIIYTQHTWISTMLTKLIRTPGDSNPEPFYPQRTWLTFWISNEYHTYQRLSNRKWKECMRQLKQYEGCFETELTK